MATANPTFHIPHRKASSRRLTTAQRRGKRAFLKQRPDIYTGLGRAAMAGAHLGNELQRRYSRSRDRGHRIAPFYKLLAREFGTSSGRLTTTLQDFVPRDDLLFIAAGERSGVNALGKALLALAQAVNDEREMKRVLIMGMIYPLLLIAAIVGLLLVADSFLWPTIIADSPVSNWPLIARLFYRLSSVASTGAMVIAAISPLVIAYVIWSLPNTKGRIRSWMDRHIMVYRMARDFKAAKLCRSLAILRANETPVIDALALLEHNSDPWMASHLALMQKEYARRGDIGSSLICTGLFSEDMQEIIDSYASLRGFEEEIERIALQMMEQMKRNTKAAIAIFGGVALVVIGVFIVGFLATVTLSVTSTLDIDSVKKAQSSTSP